DAGHAAEGRRRRALVAYGRAAESAWIVDVADRAAEQDLQVALIIAEGQDVRARIAVRGPAASFDDEQELAGRLEEHLTPLVVDVRCRGRRELTRELAAERAAILL